MATREATVFCSSTLNYIDGGPTRVTIRDGRDAQLPGWKACGFELLRHESVVRDWDDEDELLRVHHREMAGVAKELTGCDVAVVAGHIKRSPEAAARHHDLAPISLVHSDFADSYGSIILDRFHQPEGETAETLAAADVTSSQAAAARRLLILQFWRNLGPAKMDLPLAFCDARTVPRGQIRAFPVTNYAGGGFDFEALGISAPRTPSEERPHEWYVFPEMQRDEVVAFRTYDTDRVSSGEPYWTPHSAFRDPDVALGEPSRSSIELRATCLFL